LIGLRERIAGGRACEPALRAYPQSIERDVLGRLIGAPSQLIHLLEDGRLAADEPKHRPSPARHEAKRREISRPRGVVFQKEMADVGAGEEALCDGFISPATEIASAEVSAAHMDADSDIRGASRERAIDGIDVCLDQAIGIASGALDLSPDGGIAEERDGN